ncbi:Na+/H+ antiporter [Falsiroseomonas tokyonensis]|uniref:Na+/H+ antiporter n=1 Tax=Falsiroseomonas tokyonensis TaxID=430521 RepID=A0ABV7C293_9PROT|nr:Na+/H+ antiporter [Falsiroseomonas tokyonensis]MBU8541366.1 Na+/H+ antiporter [Falsiroseomonas tokyonensis]
MEIVQAVLALIAACIGFALLARRLNLPYAVILVVGGMVLAFIPGLPSVTLDPELALAFFLPPLLQASAWRTDWRAFRANLRPILFLAVGAVLFSALCIAVVAKLLIPDLPWAAAVALGAIVAPPDAVAAAAVLARLPMPRRLVTVLEGESLVNDATALVLYRFAIAAVAAGGIALEQAVASFFLVAVGGILMGLAIGWLAAWAFRRLEDTLLEIAASFVACFASFFAAEALNLSGVIAVVSTGLIMGQLQHRVLRPDSRISARAVWNFVEFVLTSLVFILVGLQLRGILDRISAHGVLELAGLALALSATLILSRFLWVFPSALVPRVLPGPREGRRTAPFGHLVVISWAGMRGVVSLAAALALPLDFPQRDLLVFLAFCAILATLVLQGTTLKWVIRRFGVTEPRVAGMGPEEAAARRHVAQATLAEVEQRAEDILEGAVARDLVSEFRERARVYHGVAAGSGQAELEARMRIRLAALRAGRRALLEQHRIGAVNDMMLATLEHEMDLEELRIQRLLGTR